MSSSTVTELGSMGDPDEGEDTRAYLIQQREEAEQKADDAMWEEALRTGRPLEAPPGYEIVETLVGVATGSEYRRG